MIALAASIVVALGVGGLPNAPGRVKYTTQKGDVVFDHAAHVARRESCRTCHGDGSVQKVGLDKKSAHALCVGCHLRQGAGPKACMQCHDDA